MPDHIVTLLWLLGFIAVAVALLKLIHKRDKKRDAG
jgi:beta-lactamase regulating signal transducer with metallopeptidase domain